VHELGALLVAATAALEGWHVTYLGADLPAADVAEAAMETEPRFIALSVVYPLDDPSVGRELQELRRRVDPSVEILLGGSGSESYRAVAERLGMRLVSDLGALRQLLRQVRN
jgi:methylmalonyl-CoA mutase cobalamin-binding subunit